MSDERDRTMTYADARGEAIDHAKDRLDSERDAIHAVLTAYSDNRSAALGNVEPFMYGLMVGLQMGQSTVDELDSKIMRAPDPAAKEVLDGG